MPWYSSHRELASDGLPGYSCVSFLLTVIDICQRSAYTASVIRSFKSKALNTLFETGRSAKIDAKLHRRILVRLDRLDVAERAEDMNLPGFNFHPLRGFSPIRYTVHVNGPWCITFEFDGDNAVRVDLEQYH